MNFIDKVEKIADEIVQMLVKKNESYGNSALDPIRIFSKADSVEQIKVRIDDKLSRLKRGNDLGEDTINDLIGYLFLLKISMEQQSGKHK